MVQVKDLTELSLRDLWEEVKDEDDWWGDMKQQTLRGVKRLLEGAMEGELMEQLHAGRYRRTETRRGYRNGYRERSLLTELGMLEHLRVPRDREGRYQTEVLPRYQRRQEGVNRMVRQMMLLYLSSGFIEYLSRFLDGGVDFSGNIALETADDVTLTHSLSGSTSHVCLGPGVMTQSDEDYAIERSVGLTVATTIEPVPVGLAG